jgi:two-component system, OmpR family, osmolarity sensor histidine kinase EnvZ
MATIDATSPAPLETAPAPLEMRQAVASRVRLSLFWRTFFLLSLLLVGSIVAWLQTFRVLESEPRAAQSAQQIASLVNLSRAALVHADAIARVSLIKQLAELEGVRVLPREITDKVQDFDSSAQTAYVTNELHSRLGHYFGACS